MTSDLASRRRAAKRIASIIRIIFRLSSSRGMNVAMTAEEFGVSERTVYRWLNVCEEAGVPYYYDALDKVHRARRGWRPRDLESD